MKIKFGAIVTDGRGKLGGHVFSKNLGGSIMRTKVTPSNPRSSAQTLVRAIFGFISQAWSVLTEKQINAWNAAVTDWQKTDIFGDLRKPSGKALFQRLNQEAQLAGYPAILTPPVKVDVPDNQLESAEFDLSTTELIIQGVSIDPGATIRLAATAPQTRGMRSINHLLRIIHYAKASAYEAKQAFTAYEQKFGIPEIGQNIFVSVQYVMPNGQVSVPQVVKATIST